MYVSTETRSSQSDSTYLASDSVRDRPVTLGSGL